ncbi:MAG: hypothetical protein ACOC80_15140, partial [Petrotogales bacterium]
MANGKDILNQLGALSMPRSNPGSGIRTLPQAPTWGQTLGSAVGTGLSGLLDSLAQQKAQDIRASNIAEAFQGYGLDKDQAMQYGKAVATNPNLGPEILKQLRNQQEEVAWQQRQGVGQPQLGQQDLRIGQERGQPKSIQDMSSAELASALTDAPEKIRRQYEPLLKEKRDREAKIERHMMPEYKKIQEASSEAEEALPIIKEIVELTKELPQGMSSALSKVWGSDAVNEFNSKIERLASIKGVKSKALPSADLPPQKIRKELNTMIRDYESSLRKKDIANDIIEENDGRIPRDFPSQLKRRAKLRSSQQKKKDEPAKNFPFIDKAPEQREGIQPEAIQGQREEIEPEELSKAV